jgi:hypothetical protein
MHRLRKRASVGASEKWTAFTVESNAFCRWWDATRHEKLRLNSTGNANFQKRHRDRTKLEQKLYVEIFCIAI